MAKVECIIILRRIFMRTLIRILERILIRILTNHHQPTISRYTRSDHHHDVVCGFLFLCGFFLPG